MFSTVFSYRSLKGFSPKERKMENLENGIQTGDGDVLIIDEVSIRDKIYIVRGMKVLLDFDLATIYGYTTKAFNQQVRNNVERFPEDFRFQLTRKEVEEIMRSKKLTSMLRIPGKKGGNRTPRR